MIHGDLGFTRSYGYQLKVVSTDIANDYFVGIADIPVTLPVGAQIFTATFTQCCRISDLADNNHDQNYYVWTTVPFIAAGAAMTSSPVNSALPVSIANVGRPFTTLTGAALGRGLPLTYRFATTQESGLPTPSPAGMVLSPNGTVQWTPAVAGKFATQVVATATDLSGNQASIVIDMLFQAVPLVGTPPVLKLNGSTTPISVTIPPGLAYTISLAATDADTAPGGGASQLTLQSGALPSSATVTPSLPVVLPSGSATATVRVDPLGIRPGRARHPVCRHRR